MKQDPWLAERLDRQTFTWEQGDDLVDFVASVQACAPAFVQAKVKTNQLAVTHGLEKTGFSLVDTLITFETCVADYRERNQLEETLTQIRVEEGGETHAKDLLNIAANHFDTSRFHLDPKIPNSKASRIKKDWIQSYVERKRGENILVANIDNQTVGFLAVLAPNSAEKTIDLIAVHKEWRKRSVGKTLITTLIEHCSPATTISVGTQVSNINALRFYESLGFKIREAHYVFHMHT